MRIRKALIVSQFVVSIGLIVATIIINAQLHFLNNMDLGFNKNFLITLNTGKFNNNSEAFKNELYKNKNINAVTIASWRAGERYGASSSMDDPSDSAKQWKFAFVDGDVDFLKTMQLTLLEGRNFSSQFAADVVNLDSLSNLSGNKKLSSEEWTNLTASKSIIISEQASKMMHLKKPVAGQVLKFGALQGTVVGVVKDFIGTSLLEPETSVIIRADAIENFGNTYIRVNPNNVRQTIGYIHSVWKKFFPKKHFLISSLMTSLKDFTGPITKHQH